MNLQLIKSITGKDEYVLLPINVYKLLKKQIDKALTNDYEAFELQDYIKNPVALIRIRARLTQEELAHHLNVTQAYISKIESQNNVSPKVLQKVTDAIKTYIDKE